MKLSIIIFLWLLLLLLLLLFKSANYTYVAGAHDLLGATEKATDRSRDCTDIIIY